MIKTVDVKESFEKKKYPTSIYDKKNKNTQQTRHREEFFNMQF